jgi:hypothetical protein
MGTKRAEETNAMRLFRSARPARWAAVLARAGVVMLMLAAHAGAWAEGTVAARIYLMRDVPPAPPSEDLIVTSHAEPGLGRVETFQMSPQDACAWLNPEGSDVGPGTGALVCTSAQTELEPNATEVVELPWPSDRPPQYYMVREGPDLYRRVGLADKEGYTVSLRAVPGAETGVEVELVRNTLIGAFDEALGAFTGKPSLLKTVCTTAAPLQAGAATVLVWRLANEGDLAGHASAAQGAPVWAVGVWRLRAPRGETQAIVTADGDMAAPDLPGVAHVGLNGNVRADLEDGDLRVVATGRLKPDGTGEGIFYVREGKESVASVWTAVYEGPVATDTATVPEEVTAQRTPEAQRTEVPGAPVWATGTWRLEVAGRETPMTVEAGGDVVVPDFPGMPLADLNGKMRRHWAPMPPLASSSVDGEGCLRAEWRDEERDLCVTIAGRLRPDGMGAGTLYVREDAEPPVGMQWRALQDEPGAPDLRRLPVEGAGASTAGLQGEEPRALVIWLEAGAGGGAQAVSVPRQPEGGRTTPDLPEPTERAPSAPPGVLLLNAQCGELAVGSPVWQEVAGAGNASSTLAGLVADGRVPLISSAELLAVVGSRAHTMLEVPSPGGPTGLRLSLGIVPRVLQGGQIQMTVDWSLQHLGALATSSDGAASFAVGTSCTFRTWVDVHWVRVGWGHGL